MGGETKHRRIDFRRINTAALGAAESILRRWLPDGRVIGAEYTARNPTRPDHKAGSFKINMKTGKWGDFATGDRGGDLIALGAYLFNMGQGETALLMAEMLGVDPHEGGS